MSGPVQQEPDDWRQLTQAVLDSQSALASTLSSLTVVRRFGDAARIDERAARLRVRPLLREVGVPAQVSWGETAGERVKQRGRSNGKELAVRAERLNAAAVDALIRFYLDGRHPPGDEAFAETRRALGRLRVAADSVFSQTSPDSSLPAPPRRVGTLGVLSGSLIAGVDDAGSPPETATS